MKRIALSGAVAALSILALAREARAFELGTPASEHPHRSPQNFALELRFGPYYPNIDEEPGLKGKPFSNTFGDNAHVYVGLEFDWQVLRIPGVGTLGPGIGVGTVGFSRSVRTVSGRDSGDETNLRIYPMYAVAVLRADVFWRDLGIPLVPYAKAGLAWAPWRASNTGGTSEADGVKGSGDSWGNNLALGLSFSLDALDLGATRNMDNATGINNTYVYIEGYMLSANGLGSSTDLRVGTRSWVAGLSFEF